MNNGESKEFRIEKTAGFAPNGHNVFVFFDDIESGVIDSNKWDLKTSIGSTGIRTDYYKIGQYSLGLDVGPGGTGYGYGTHD